MNSDQKNDQQKGLLLAVNLGQKSRISRCIIDDSNTKVERQWTESVRVRNEGLKKHFRAD